MNELEALERVKSFLGYNYCSVDLPKELKCIEQSLKALEIIKEKCVTNLNLYLVVCCENYDIYSNCRKEINLTQQEFDLLKEELEDVKD